MPFCFIDDVQTTLCKRKKPIILHIVCDPKYGNEIAVKVRIFADIVTNCKNCKLSFRVLITSR